MYKDQSGGFVCSLRVAAPSPSQSKNGEIEGAATRWL